MTRSILCIAFAIAVMTAHGAAGQTATEVETLLASIARVEGPHGKVGSGIVVGLDNGTVRLITSRHVVEAGPRQAVTPQDKRACDLPLPTVSFKNAPAPIRAASALCSDTADFAVIEIPAAQAPPTFGTLRRPGVLLDKANSTVFLLGLPNGTWAQRSATVIWNSAETSRTGDTLQAKASSVEEGFSGGAVIDVTLGLVGMVITTDGIRTVALRWERISAILSQWQLSANRLDEAATGLGPVEFEHELSHDVLEEGARTAVRTYQSALTLKQSSVIGTVYPELGSSGVTSLFGDAVRIDLKLTKCSDLTPEHVITCAYTMTVLRRTGTKDGDQFPSNRCEKCARPRMAFHVSPGPLQWTVNSIEVVP